MVRFLARFLISTAIVVAFTIFVNEDVAAQPKKPADGILVEALALRAGEPLSIRTPVQRPAAITGVLSWTIETRRHRGRLAVTALSPDGKHIATGGNDGIIHIWDAESGEFQRALVGHGSYVYGLAWSPDGKSLASAGSFDGTAKIWEAATGMTLRTLRGHKGYTHHVAWSRDGKSLVVAGGTSGFMTLWDVAKAEQVKTSETGNPITGVAWSTGDSRIAVSGSMIGVQVWDLRIGKPAHVLAVPGQTASCVAWSPDGKWLVGGTATKTLIWDPDEGKLKHEFDVPGYAAAFTKQSDSLAVSAGMETKVWKGFDNEPKSFPLTEAFFLHWSPDGSALFGGSPVSVKWLSITGKSPPREIDAAADFPAQLTPGRPVITGLHSTTPHLWDPASGKLIGKLEGHTAGVTAAAWSKDGKLLATASQDKTVRIWDAAGKAQKTHAGHEATVLCLAWADGKTLASGSADKTVRVWQAATDASKMLRQHKNAVHAVIWSKDGKQLVSGDEDHGVLIWTPENDKPPQSITAGAPVRSLALSANSKHLAVGTATGYVEVYSPVGGKSIQTFERAGSPPQVTSMAWSPDNITLLAGRGNHSAQVWKVGAVNAVADYPGMAPVNHVAFTPLGNSAVLSESDRSIRVFDLANGQLRSSVIVDGKQLAVIAAAGHYRIHDEATCELVYVVQTAKGQETLSPKEFTAKYKFKNNPAAVMTMDK